MRDFGQLLEQALDLFARIVVHRSDPNHALLAQPEALHQRERVVVPRPT
jgi:hypothetical protein